MPEPSECMDRNGGHGLLRANGRQIKASGTLRDRSDFELRGACFGTARPTVSNEWHLPCVWDSDSISTRREAIEAPRRARLLTQAVIGGFGVD